MKIDICLDGSGTPAPSTGAKSEAHWSNPAALAALDQLFGTKPNETITHITLTSEGITAHFEFK